MEIKQTLLLDKCFSSLLGPLLGESGMEFRRLWLGVSGLNVEGLEKVCCVVGLAWYSFLNPSACRLVGVALGCLSIC